MKAGRRDLARKLADRPYRIVFACGPDEAGAAAAVARAIARLGDAGERCELSGAELKADPVRLVDEARSTSLFGDRRHVLARVSNEEAHDALALFCDMVDRGEAGGAWPVFVHATGATDKSRSAKLLAEREDALVAMFYAPELSDVKADIAAMAGAAGLKLEAGLAERIARAANLDLRLAKSEIDKLALYLDADAYRPREATAAHFAAIGAASEDDGFQPIIDAALGGQGARLAGEIARLRSLSLNPVAVTLALERRVAQLVALRAKLPPRGDIGATLERERVFPRERAAIAEQLRRWPPARLERLVERVAALHRALLGASQSAELLLSQELVEIARTAAASRA